MASNGNVAHHFATPFEFLTCANCRSLFSVDHLPVNLFNAVVCQPCVRNLLRNNNTKIKCPREGEKLPVNMAMLSLLRLYPPNAESLGLPSRFAEQERKAAAQSLESSLINLAHLFAIPDGSENTGLVVADGLSRFVQKRLSLLLSAQVYLTEGRLLMLRSAKCLVERVVTELVLMRQSTAHISSLLWSAVRARGCQFLGPANQEQVLRLVLVALAKGELIARKSLVLFIVDKMADQVPSVSKTCVGHVVQLLYRASCFNLKQEFREYGQLRREHDAQIVQIAVEAGLRISADQWSSLLYGDTQHRQHMEQIVDSMTTPHTLTASETSSLQSLFAETDLDGQSNSAEVMQAVESVLRLDVVDRPDLWTVAEAARNLEVILQKYSKLERARFDIHNQRAQKRNQTGPNVVKARMCRDTLAGRPCPRAVCNYAHGSGELRCPPVNAVLPLMDVPPPPVPMPPIADAMFSQNTTVDQMAQQFNEAMQLDAHQQQQSQMQQEMMENGPILLDNGLAQAAAQAAANGQAPPLVVPVIMHQQDMNSGMVQPSFTHALMFPSNDPSAASTLVLPSRQPTAAPLADQAQLIPLAPMPAEHALFPALIPSPMLVPSGGPVQPNTTLLFNSAPFWMPEPSRRVKNGAKSSASSGQQFGGQSNGKHELETASRFPDSIWEIDDDQVLLARRQEIVTCLNKMREEAHPVEEDEELRGHVSYTVANSVLFEDLDLLPSSSLELPPLPALHTLPISFHDAVVVPQPVFSLGGARDLCQPDPLVESLPGAQTPCTSGGPRRLNSSSSVDSFPAGSSPPYLISTVRTMCPAPIFSQKASAPATVQADCSVMNVKDMFERPLVISTIQQTNLSPQASLEMVDPMNMVDHVPQVIRPLSLNSDPQRIVSATLDRILNVKERIFDVEKHGGMGSAVEKAQLKLELNIVNRQISSLDTPTKHSCLLKELEVVDKKIEDMNASA